MQPERKHHIPPTHGEKGAHAIIIIFLFVTAPGFRCSALVPTCSPGMRHNSEDERRGADSRDKQTRGVTVACPRAPPARAALASSGGTIGARAVQRISAATDNQ